MIHYESCSASTAFCTSLHRDNQEISCTAGHINQQTPPTELMLLTNFQIMQWSPISHLFLPPFRFVPYSKIKTGIKIDNKGRNPILATPCKLSNNHGASQAYAWNDVQNIPYWHMSLLLGPENGMLHQILQTKSADQLSGFHLMN